MSDPPVNYRREFLKSPHHAWFGLFTLGAGFIAGATAPIFLLGGATAYVLGWIYLPDLSFFKKWVDTRRLNEKQKAALAEIEAFVKRREGLLAALSTSRRQRYHQLAAVCRDIEHASADNPLASSDPATDPRLRKLDELMWTYLRMLTIEESLDRFMESERRENVPGLVKEAQEEVAEISAEVEALKKEGRKLAAEQKEKLLTSRLERLEVLNKRLHRIEQSQANLALVVSEQERLEQQIKLIRADAIASKNAASLSARIDATVEHLDQTNKWLAELDEFKDLVGDLPATELRVGFQAAAPPPLGSESTAAKTGKRALER
jgi:hypothetical protein